MYTYRVNSEQRMIGTILYVTDNSDTHYQLPEPVLSPILLAGTITDSFHCSGNSSLF
jgi:hypothetical protein